MKFRFRILFTILLLLVILPVRMDAEEAENISSIDLITDSENMAYPLWLFNQDETTPQTSKPGLSFTLTHEKGFGSLYIVFDVPYGAYTLKNNDDGREVTCGQNNFIHEFVDVQGLFGMAPKSLTITFGDHEVKLCEIRAYTEGDVPADVQKWKRAPEEGVDLLAFPTHGDDEELFFAGMLPYYAGEKEYEVQVAYSTDHHNLGMLRTHEMLNSLWAVGVRNYPVFGPFPDFLTKNASAAVAAIQPYKFTEDDVKAYVVEQIRRFKPLVIVGHDLEGEYGHGFHRLYGRIVQEASDISMDPDKYPESAEKYGVWDAPKTYTHLFADNPIHMNWDVPLEKFDGMTAYEVSKEIGFPTYKSQYSGFAWYFNYKDTAEDIKEMSPCDFGLYRTTVGADVNKNDLFENLEPRKLGGYQPEEETEPAETIQATTEETTEPQNTAEETKTPEPPGPAPDLQKKLAEKTEKRMNMAFLALGISLLFALILTIILTVLVRKKRK